MKEIKLTIDGKEIQLTDEQLKMLGIMPGKKKENPFERVVDDEIYYFVNYFGDVDWHSEANDREDGALFNVANYFNDEQFAEQVALHQLLYHQLLKFAYDNECEDTAEWDGRNYHWCIYYNPDDLKYCVAGFVSHKFDGVWFSSEDAAKRAIKEVVEPFMEEHPEFVW